MMFYLQTVKGLEALQHRDEHLCSKQRQLLLLIGMKDIYRLSQDKLSLLLKVDILKELLALGYIEPALSTDEYGNACPIEIDSDIEMTAVKTASNTATPHSTLFNQMLATYAPTMSIQ